jgi:hypothetical protein
LSQYCLHASTAVDKPDDLPSAWIGVPAIGHLPSLLGSGHSGMPCSRTHLAKSQCSRERHA